MTGFLDLDDLLAIADIATGAPAVVRDPGLLASAPARPQTSVIGEDAYPALLEKAAALLHSPARNRALIDGNTRLAWLATYTFLRINGVDLVATQEEVVDLVLVIAEGAVDEVGEIAERREPRV